MVVYAGIDAIASAAVGKAAVQASTQQEGVDIWRNPEYKPIHVRSGKSLLKQILYWIYHREISGSDNRYSALINRCREANIFRYIVLRSECLRVALLHLTQRGLLNVKVSADGKIDPNAVVYVRDLNGAIPSFSPDPVLLDDPSLRDAWSSCPPVMDFTDALSEKLNIACANHLALAHPALSLASDRDEAFRLAMEIVKNLRATKALSVSVDGYVAARIPLLETSVGNEPTASTKKPEPVEKMKRKSKSKSQKASKESKLVAPDQFFDDYAPKSVSKPPAHYRLKGEFGVNRQNPNNASVQFCDPNGLSLHEDILHDWIAHVAHFETSLSRYPNETVRGDRSMWTLDSERASSPIQANKTLDDAFATLAAIHPQVNIASILSTLESKGRIARAQNLNQLSVASLPPHTTWQPGSRQKAIASLCDLVEREIASHKGLGVPAVQLLRSITYSVQTIQVPSLKGKPFLAIGRAALEAIAVFVSSGRIVVSPGNPVQSGPTMTWKP
jgi:hypothetical protein